jgi:hypothetical protein
VRLDYQNSLYIADRDHHRIQKYLADSSNATIVAGLANRTPGSSLSQLSYPSHVLVDASGNMCIIDTGNERVSYLGLMVLLQEQ